jgi:hypothetical protein
MVASPPTLFTFVSDYNKLFNLGWNNNTLCTGTVKTLKEKQVILDTHTLPAEPLHNYFVVQNLFSTGRMCMREQRKKQFDWLVTNTDVITIQSHLLFYSGVQGDAKTEEST